MLAARKEVLTQDCGKCVRPKYQFLIENSINHFLAFFRLAKMFVVVYAGIRPRRGAPMNVYLDICCFNRPFDEQSSLIVYLETEAKLHVQELVR